jgi:rubrerythrin
MGGLFKAREVINMAIDIGKNGSTYYDTLVECAENAEVKSIYKDLAKIQREHIMIFQDTLGSVDDYQPPETDTHDYEAYMKALVDSLIFTDVKVACDMARNMSHDVEAIQTAIRAEKDSILFFTEMLDFVHASARDIVTKLIAEEKSHIIHLIELRKNLNEK